MAKYICINAFDKKMSERESRRMYINAEKITLVYEEGYSFTTLVVDGLENPLYAQINPHNFMVDLIDFLKDKREGSDVLWVKEEKDNE